MTRHLVRRELIKLVGGVAPSWPVMAWAQGDDLVRALLGRILRLQADGAADKIDQYIEGIKSQIGFTTQLPWGKSLLAARRVDALRVLRQVPAIEVLSELDPAGHEQLRVSRFGIDTVGVGTDYSQDPKFTETVYYGPVDFRPEPGPAKKPQPYMTLALAGKRSTQGVSVAEISLKHIQELITRIKVGDHGVAYVLDNRGRVIAHSDVSLVQQDFSSLGHVQAARMVGTVMVTRPVEVARDVKGREVLATYSRVASLGWMVFVEMPIEEANAAAQ